MAEFYAHAADGSDVFGTPAPAPGVRMTFAPELMFDARERLAGEPVPRELRGDEGFVVHEDPRLVLTWPCRLWRVTDARPVWRPPRAGWFRCAALTVEAEMPARRVFGGHGAAVLAVVEQARGLTPAQVARLAALDDAGERRIRDAHVRSAGGRVPVIGRGADLVRSALEAAARRADPGLFTWDDEDGVWILDDPAWSGAGHAALAAALGVGAPEAFTGPERDALVHRWATVPGLPGR